MTLENKARKYYSIDFARPAQREIAEKIDLNEEKCVIVGTTPLLEKESPFEIPYPPGQHLLLDAYCNKGRAIFTLTTEEDREDFLKESGAKQFYELKGKCVHAYFFQGRMVAISLLGDR